MRSNSFPFVLTPLRRSQFWRETHTKGLRVISPARPEVEEGRKVWEKTGRLDLSKQGRRNQSAWMSSQEKEKDTVNRRQHSYWHLRKFNAKYTPKIYDSLQMHGELHQKCHTNTSFLRLELTQVRVCSFVPSSTLSVMFCVSVMKCVMPRVGNEKKKH